MTKSSTNPHSRKTAEGNAPDHAQADGAGGITSRFFVVGCPRSGTTVLQSVLSAHPRIATFPESRFFAALPPKPYMRSLPFASSRIRSCAEQFLHAIDRPDLIERFPINSRWMRRWAEAFVSVLDQLTQEAGKDVWLEKTPDHLSCIQLVRRFIPQSKFVHILRKGTDVVASLVQATQEYPESWGGQAWSIEKCVEVWNRAVRKHRKYAFQPGHLLVRHDELIEDPQQTIQGICQFLGIPFEPSMLQPREQSQWVIDNPYKAEASLEIRQPENKFDKLFDDRQRAQIRAMLSDASSLLSDTPG